MANLCALVPLIIDTNLRYLKLKWNNNGSVLAISGAQFARSPQGEEKEVSVVQFYDPFGQVRLEATELNVFQRSDI
jgi:hypothetical protein